MTGGSPMTNRTPPYIYTYTYINTLFFYLPHSRQHTSICFYVYGYLYMDQYLTNYVTEMTLPHVLLSRV